MQSRVFAVQNKFQSYCSDWKKKSQKMNLRWWLIDNFKTTKFGWTFRFKQSCTKSNQSGSSNLISFISCLFILFLQIRRKTPFYFLFFYFFVPSATLLINLQTQVFCVLILAMYHKLKPDFLNLATIGFWQLAQLTCHSLGNLRSYHLRQFLVQQIGHFIKAELT